MVVVLGIYGITQSTGKFDFLDKTHR